jgi:hypothetical protein
MRINTLCRKTTVAVLALGAMTLGSGCGPLDVELTSSPEVVGYGDPVTFGIKITNTSQCPLKEPGAALVAFLPLSEFNFFQLIAGVPADEVPPEVLAFLEALQTYFDELCAGGDPTPPDPPELANGAAMTTSCRRSGSEVVCEASGPVAGQMPGGGSMTLAALGERLRCEIDAGTMRCTFRVAVAGPQAAGGASAALAIQSLTCVTGPELLEELGGPAGIVLGDDPESVAVCLVGDVENPQGLDPAQMATGQVVLPARGSGLVRNLLVGISDGEDAGVCKGGANGGQACDQDDSGDCPGSTCGEGICVDGANDGLGCDQATAGADCPGGSCVLCFDDSDNEFPPLDCTETRIAPRPAPTASPWGLAALAAALLAGGTWLLRRRLPRHG